MFFFPSLSCLCFFMFFFTPSATTPEKKKKKKKRAAVKLSAARGKTMETAPTATKKNEAKASPSPSRKRSRSRSRSRASAGGGSGSSSRSGSSSGGSKTASAAPPSSSSSSPLGPLLSSLTVPQGWFLHFYALGSVAAAAVLGAALRGGGGNGGGGGGKSFSSNSSRSPPLPASSVAALALLLLHVLRRWAECSWQASWPSGARMHAVAYAFGMSYYAVLPLSLLPSGAFGAAAAAVRDGRGEEAKGAGAAVASFLSKKLGLVSSSAPSPLQHPASFVLGAFSSLGPLRLAGVAVFAAGSLLQALSHAALAALQRRAAAAGELYLAPSAGAGDSRLLSLCACPHYLGEIVIYAGLAMVAAGWWGGFPSFPSSSAPWSLSSPSSPSPSSSWRSSPSPPPSSPSSSSTSAGVLPLLVLVWVSVNLVLASAECKRWYRRRFPKEFPEARAALVPGVF